MNQYFDDNLKSTKLRKEHEEEEEEDDEDEQSTTPNLNTQSPENIFPASNNDHDFKLIDKRSDLVASPLINEIVNSCEQ